MTKPIRATDGHAADVTQPPVDLDVLSHLIGRDGGHVTTIENAALRTLLAEAREYRRWRDAANADVDLDGLQAIAEAATPGPWQWRYYGSHSPDLVATHSGMLYVMGFARLGMAGAQPTFADRTNKDGRWNGGLMHKFTEWWGREVKLAPDARYMARFDPSTALALIARARLADALAAENARLQESFATFRSMSGDIREVKTECLRWMSTAELENIEQMNRLRERVRAAAKVMCARCQHQGEPNGVEEGEYYHAAYTTEGGTGVPAEPCEASAIWVALGVNL